jgi:4-amino-4-deoxy-L-arabinose transferase-like glycosyltransferase
MLHRLGHTESSPPLYYCLAWLWTRAFGTGEIGLRSLSALFGVLTVPAAYSAAAVAFGRREAKLAAILVTASPILIWYSQEARAYALLVLSSAAALVYFFRALKTPSRSSYWLWSLFSTLAVATHYFTIFMVVPQAAMLMRANRSRRTIAMGAIPILAFAALLPLALHQSHKTWDFQAVPLKTRIAEVPKQFLVGYDAPLERILAVVTAGCFAAAFVLVARKSDPSREAAKKLAVIAGCAVGAPIVLALAGKDYVLTLYVLGALVPVLLVVAAGLVRSLLGLVAALIVLAAFVSIDIAVPLNREYQRDDWRGAAKALREHSGPRALVITPASVLGIYIHGLRAPSDSRIGVREIDLVGMATKPTGGTFTAPRALPAKLPPGFRVVRKIFDTRWTVVIMRSPKRSTVSVARLRSLHLGSWRDHNITIRLQR